MSIEDRLRESLEPSVRGAAPSEDAWTSIERRIERRRRHIRHAWLAAGSLIGAALVASLTWTALALHANRPVVSPPPKGKLGITDVRVFAQRNFAKVGGVVRNNTDRAVGASVTCRLRNAAGRVVGSARGGVPRIRPHGASPNQTIASGATLVQATVADCTAQATSPAPTPQPAPPLFQPGGAAFFDENHGIVVGSYGTSGCESGCRGWIQVTADGGRTWTRVAATRYPIVSVTVFGTSDAWAVENETCAYICPALLRSTDGGRTWTDLGQVNVISPSFVSPTVGFAVGYQRSETNAPLLATADGGRTWNEVSRPCGPNTFPNWGDYPAFVSPTHGWILCDGQPSAGSQSRTLLETTDGGGTWRSIAGAIGSQPSVGGLGTSGYPGALFFRPDGKGWIGIGYAALEVTTSTDAGRHWHSGGVIETSFGGQFRALGFVNDAVGYALVDLFSSSSRLVTTRDGGRTWRVVTSWGPSA